MAIQFERIRTISKNNAILEMMQLCVEANVTHPDIINQMKSENHPGCDPVNLCDYHHYHTYMH